MNDILYLEPDEEITSVIDKIKKCESTGVALVIPRGGTLGQSIINLKLLQRKADDLGKVILLVTTDKVTKNLAGQVKIQTFEKAAEAEKAKIDVKESAREDYEDEASKLGMKVNTYKRYDLSGAQAEERPEEKDDENEIEVQKKKIAEVPVEDKEAEPEETEAMASDESFEDHSHNLAEELREYERHSEEEEIESEKLKAESIKQEDFDDISPIKPEKPKDKQEIPMKKMRPEGARRILIAFFSILVLAVLVSSYIFLPSAEASIVLKTTDYDNSFEISADRNQKTPDVEKLAIAATLVDLTKDDSLQSDATGTKDIGTKASGKITIYNSWSTTEQTVPKGSQFSGGGKTFVSLDDVKVPGGTPTLINGVPGVTAGTAEVSVQASEAGDSYNIGASAFTITSLAKDKQDKITGKSTAAMAGGTTQVVKLVTDDDLKNAQKALETQIADGMKAELTSKGEAAGLKISDSGINNTVVVVSADKKAGDQADNFTTTMTLKSAALGFSESDLRKVSLDWLATQIGSDQMIVNPEMATLSYEISDNSVDNGTMKFTVAFKGKVGSKLSESEIKSAIKNKSYNKANSYLAGLAGTSSVSLKITPSFLKQTPLLNSRLHVKFDYER